jgi:hypothetical protein
MKEFIRVPGYWNATDAKQLSAKTWLEVKGPAVKSP